MEKGENCQNRKQASTRQTRGGHGGFFMISAFSNTELWDLIYKTYQQSFSHIII
jgi:hypothetical protein